MVLLIFPNQLFYNLKHLDINEIIYLIEEPRYFTDYNFHKLKLAYHRATMKKYYDYLKSKEYNIKYINFSQVSNSFYKNIKTEIKVIFPADHKLKNKLDQLFGKKINYLDNKNFLINLNELETIKQLIYKNNKYSHEEFYKYQRKKLNILIDENNKPINGKWSFDKENRIPLPKDHTVPKTVTKVKNNKYIIEAKNYINNNFPNNYGSLDNFIYPIDNKRSKLWLNKFLKERLSNFGPYEDAVKEEDPFIYHSVLSPMMNIGLITDTEVIKISYEYYQTNKKIPIQSFEGFIRQIIGWRNYVYTIYLLEGEKMYESNYLKHNNKLNYEKMWLGETKIKPIDSIINKLVNYAYAHHIERLMYLGNFMLLCQIDPKDVYRIFMEWSIDSYDWVMIPNVFGMSQFASTIMMTRPYFASSNYINKMSDFKKDGEWDKIWNALYYNFINKHQNILRKNYAVAQQVKHWDNKNDQEKKDLINIAKKYLDNFLSNN